MTASTQPRPTGQRNTALPFIGAGVFLGAAALLGWFSWEASVPDPLAHQVFVCAYVAVAVLGAVCLLLRFQPRILQALALGVLIGVAVGTTPWQHLGEVFWYQLWWSVPLGAGLALVLWRAPVPQEHPNQN